MTYNMRHTMHYRLFYSILEKSKYLIALWHIYIELQSWTYICNRAVDSQVKSNPQNSLINGCIIIIRILMPEESITVRHHGPKDPKA